MDLIERQAAIDAANRADYRGLAVEDVRKVTDEVVKEVKRVPSAQPVDKAYLCDWYINSVAESEPVWTEEHVLELVNDFYVIPKEKR